MSADSLDSRQWFVVEVRGHWSDVEYERACEAITDLMLHEADADASVTGRALHGKDGDHLQFLDRAAVENARGYLRSVKNAMGSNDLSTPHTYIRKLIAAVDTAAPKP